MTAATLFESSYVALVLVVAGLTMRVAWLLHRMQEMRGIWARIAVAESLSQTPVDGFEGRLLGFGEPFTPSDLAGADSILLFIDPLQSPSPVPYEALKSQAAFLGYRARGRLFVVCGGPEADCEQVVTESFGHWCMYPTVLDGAATLSRRFGIVTTPTYVMVNAAGVVTRRAIARVQH